MKEIFDFQRFGKYYCSDLKATFNNTWITVLVTALSGIIAYLFSGIMNLMLSGNWGSYGLVGRSITFVIISLTLCITIPAKAYGGFTDKRAGSFFTLVPASALEKFLSMVINTCIIAPLAFVVIFITADSLICLIDSNCGESLISLVASGADGLNNMLSDLNSSSDLKILGTGELIFSQIVSFFSFILTFLVGALYFKSHKVGKTILAYIIVSMALSLISSPLIAAFGDSFGDFIQDIAFDPESAFRWLKVVGHTINVLFLIGFNLWAYFRVKTVKY